MGATNIAISVPNIAEILVSFNVIRMKRSTTGATGTYSLLTADTPSPASLLSVAVGPYNVAGKTLSLKLDQGSEIDVLFDGSAPLVTTDVAAQINYAVGHTVASSSHGKLLLTSTLTGTISKVLILGGSAATEFGWVVNQKSLGLDAHITLQPTVSAYNYVDRDGQSGYFYKAQFYNTTTGLESEDSNYFEGDVGVLIPADRLCTLTLDLVDGTGAALPNQSVSFYPQQELLQVDGYQVALNRAPVSVKTDNSGHAEIRLVQGLHVRVVFDGTSLIRDILIPSTTAADLMTMMSLAPDPYDIQTIPFPPAIRRTL